ncbi:MAG: SPOR domain-containing protein [Gammaproteobacteria bacterium]|nr:SPOR domain-containing protein [Gammaproteobacteria bacterium]NNC55949.1 SPOR domain-containing protein [Woeseiaceae bacterium]
MKNLLLLLLLANILYFLWGLYNDEGPQPGVAIIDEAGLGPPLAVKSSREGRSVASVGAVPGSGDRTDLEALVGRSCVTVGPFTESADADTAARAHTNEGMQSRVRTTQGQVFVGHWVQIRNVRSEAAAKDMLVKLSAGGLEEAYMVRTDDEGLKISLGVFGDIERAEKVELQARSLDLPADISPRMAERAIYYVDIALPPRQGAGGIIAKYGEEQVLLRDLATCPR